MSAPGAAVRQARASPRPEFLAAALAFGGGLFLAIASQVVTGTPLVALDLRVAHWLHSNATPALTRFFLDVSLAHDVAAVSVYTLALAGTLAVQRDWYWARRVLIVVVSGFLWNTALKLAYVRARPVFDHPLVALTTFSFPSGHTAITTLFYGVFALVLASRVQTAAARLACLAAFASMVLLVAFSRIYLGAHYLSDVAAAACASVAWIAFVLMALPRFAR